HLKSEQRQVSGCGFNPGRLKRMNLDKQPSVTIIMPVRNEADYIDGGLRAILRQDYPAECTEILIVDGMSTDSTREIIQQEIEKRTNLYLLDNPEQIVPTAMNRAIRQATGEIIVRVDGHCEIAHDYVSQCVHHLLESDADGVGGPIETIGETPTAQAIALAMSSRFGMGGSAFRTIKDRAMWVETVAFAAYKMETIRQLGLYDEELVRNQDDEYNYRLLKQGGKVLLTPDIRSRYYSRGSLRKLWRQFYQYGFWKVRVMQKHPSQLRLRQFVPVLFVLSLILSTLLPLCWGMLGLILLAYSLADFVVSTGIAKEHGWRYLPTLILAHLAMHVAYGLGFGVGLIRFAHRWTDKVGRVPSW
ncbi:MAG: glycosyltransferase family 2 protein, partial [Anaerolineaceae bacterium]